MMGTTLIVDLCGTLIHEDTTRGFLRSLPLYSWRRALRSLGFTRTLSVLSRVLRRDLSREVLIFVTRGLHKDLLYRHAETYVRERLACASNVAVRDAITKAQSEGQYVYIATASLDAVASAVVEQLHLDGMISSQLGYDQRGICNGRFSVDVTGKKWAYLSANVPGDRLRSTTAYTDNSEDCDLIRNAQRTYFCGQPSQLSGLAPSDLMKIVFLSARAQGSHTCG
jgi:phosphoserine phosphatase